MEDKELIAWAVQEIRELDELCRSSVPGYGSLDSAEMQQLARLKDMAGDAEVKAPIDYESVLEQIETHLHKASVAFTALDFKAVKEQVHNALTLAVNRPRR